MQPAASLAWVFPASHHLCSVLRGMPHFAVLPLVVGAGRGDPRVPYSLRRLWTMTGQEGKRAVPSWVGLSCPDSMWLCKGLRVELAIYR